MSLIKAFPGLRPAAGRAADVLAPPYDVMSADEARQMVVDRPHSFLHISRAEVDLPPEIDPYAPAVYAQAAENLQALRAAGVLQQDSSDCYYLYRLTDGPHSQLGVVAAASVAAYDSDRIKQHELTRPAKEQDRIDQIDALNAQTGPVFLVYPDAPQIDALLEQGTAGEPAVGVTANDGVQHQLWVMDDAATCAELTALFEALPALYVADGHHRSAAASRVAAQRRAGDPDASDEAPHNYFLSVIFPRSQTRILDYNRVVRDLNGLEREAFLNALHGVMQVTPEGQPVRPRQRGEFGLYLPGQWYRLQLPQALLAVDDPVAALDVSLLSDHLLAPLLGIVDQRTDSRIDFVGGVRGLEALQTRVDAEGWAAAFSLFPTTMADLMAVSDAGKIMPPKSTWFEPKLADGLVSHLL